jgi:ribonuclease P protein component
MGVTDGKLMAKQFTFGKNERLKSRKLIEQLFKEGRSFGVLPFRVYYLLNRSANSPIQCGVGVSTKNFKKAVDRNRIKRLIKEAWRLQKGPLQEKTGSKDLQLNLFLIYTGKELPGYKEVYAKVTVIINKLVTIVPEAK